MKIERIKSISVIILKVTKCPVLISTGSAHGGGGDLAARLPLTLSTTPFSNVALTPPLPSDLFPQERWDMAMK